MDHLQCGERFREMLVDFKDAQLRMKKYKYSMDTMIVNRMINYHFL